jgi:GNAT superfamily N-acetyltransferase
MKSARYPEPTEVPAIADLWWRSWHDAHADIVSSNLVELRTYESFLNRAQKKISIIRVVGSIGRPVGMCYVVDDELQQLFVSASARGSGAASTPFNDAEFILQQSGVNKAWLACSFGNARAERFYEKCGWINVGKMIDDLETSVGVFKLETWRFEKEL